MKTNLTQEQQTGLREVAKEVSRNSYSPYSRFAVGAAVLTTEGTMIAGTNLENAPYGLTICAKRSALFHAISKGRGDIVAIGIYAPTQELALPCGACRQVLSELAPKAEVLCFAQNAGPSCHSVADLLPTAFGSDHMV